MKRLLVFILLVLAGCSDAVIPYYPPHLVIEGWIEAGRSPVVMVTTSVPVTDEKRDISSLEENMVRWATVSVSDGENEVFLTGQYDKDYFPPYIYTSSWITGEVGKTYRLKVKYSGRAVEAETVIPAPHALEYVRPEKISDENYVISVGLKDNETTKDYYKSFVKVAGKDSVFRSAFLGLVDDAVLQDGINDMQIFNGFAPSGLEKDVQMYFKEGEKVALRFCTLGQDAFQYWTDFDDVASLSRNPFFPVTKKIRSNIKGGLGYWAGYGSSYYVVECTTP